MSNNAGNLNRRLICATCLSHDRKLIAMRDSQACTSSYLELSLKLTDRICWECHNFVRRMVQFKSRARMAQACLWNMANGLVQELPCLSRMTASSGVSVDIPPDITASADVKIEPQEQITLTIKQEVDEDETSEASTSYQQAPPSRGVPLAARVTADAVPTLMTLADGNADVEIDDTRKGDVDMSAPSLVPSINKRRKPAKSRLKVNPDPSHVTYTEKALTEEEMVQWREAKAQTDYYRRSIPSERCEMCLEIFDHERFAQTHAKRHTEDYGDLECRICRQRVVNDRWMVAHRVRHYRLFTCRYCSFVWDDPNTMRYHASELHGIPQTIWDCDQCDRQFPTTKLMNLHAKVHKHTKCRVCSKHVNEQNITRHMLQHSGGEAWVPCAVCGRVVRGAAALRAHMRTHRDPADDEVDTIAYCTDCGIQFKNRILLNCHLKSGKHATKDEYRFECDHCGKKFLNLSALRGHLDFHSDTVYPCEQCDKVFNTRSGSRRHTRQVHEGKVKRRDFICDHCGKAYAIKKMLTEHLYSHTGARPYVCSICGDTFAYKSALYLHGRYKHKIQKKQDTKKTAKVKEADKSK